MNRPGSPPPTGSAREGLSALPASIQGLIQEAASAVSARVHLLALELRRARDVLPKIIALLVLAALVAVTGWIALWAAVVLMLVELAGWSPVWTMVLVLGINVAAAAVLASRALSLVPLLALPATLHHMTVRNADSKSEATS